MNIKNSPFCFEDLFCEYPEGFPSAVEVLSCTLVSPTLSTNNPLLVPKEARNIPGFFGYQQWIVSGERRADERA